MDVRDAFRFSWDALRANRLRTLLTALGLVIGNASVILVVTISLTSREYILDQISSIGSNMVYAYYEGAQVTGRTVDADYIKIADVEAIRAQLGASMVAATGVQPGYDRAFMGGREQDVTLLGVDGDYALIRDLVIVAGRFIDTSDTTLRAKVALMTDDLARRLYGSPQAAVGRPVKIHRIQFTVIGVFKERNDSFGLSELTRETLVLPISVMRYFSAVERIDPLYVKARDAASVVQLTEQVRRIVESRHRPGARYRVENLSAILDTAKSISMILTVVLLLVAAIALVISGIGIMNIMLVTVTERTREIGVRMAVGATRRYVQMQFMLEAVLMSVGGGVLGTLLGVAVPVTVGIFVPEVKIPVSGAAIAASLGVSVLVGLIFGTLPANRASRLNPTEALRYE